MRVTAATARRQRCVSYTLVSIGENVGSVINGKSNRFSRPVLILRKLAHGFFLVAPTTTQPREGSWYVLVCLSDQDEYVCLSQIRTIVVVARGRHRRKF
jgi:hypothetical protein